MKIKTNSLMFAMLLASTISAPSLAESMATKKPEAEQTRRLTGPCKQKCSCKCNCCFVNELNFNALSLNTNLNLEVPQLPAALVTLLNTLGLGALVDFLDNLADTLNNDVLPKPNALLNVTLPGGLTAGILAQLLSVLTPVDLAFEVPRSIDSSKNVEVDLHLFIKAGVLKAIAGLVDPESALIEFLNNIKITGSLAGQLQVLNVVLCALGTANLDLDSILGLADDDNVQTRVTLCLQNGQLIPGSLANLSLNLNADIDAILASIGVAPAVIAQLLLENLLGLNIAATSIRFGQLPCQPGDLQCSTNCSLPVA